MRYALLAPTAFAFAFAACGVGLVGFVEPSIELPDRAGDASPDASPALLLDASPDADADAACDGRCIQQVAAGQPQLGEIAIDEAEVFFTLPSSDTGGYALSKAPKLPGGDVVHLIPTGELREPTSAPVLDGPFVYVSAYSAGGGAGARRLLKDGGLPEAIDACNTALGVVVDDTAVFWISAVCGGKFTLRRTSKVPDGGAPAVDLVIHEDDQYAYANYGYLALGDDSVYWVGATKLYGISKTFTAADTPKLLLDRTGKSEVFRALAVDDRIYARFGSEILALDRAGGSATSLVTRLGVSLERSALVVSGAHVYFTAPEDGYVARVPKAGGAVERIAEEQAYPRGLAVDRTHVYWSNAKTGTIWRARRSP